MPWLRLQGGGALAGVPLPAHKVRPHDVVELRPSKGDASHPAIAGGIVHRSACSISCGSERHLLALYSGMCCGYRKL